MWRRDPHLAGKTGLSRYYDFGQGPVPEVMEGHDPYYKNVAKQLIAENIPNNYLVPPTKTQAQHGWPSITAYDCKGKLSAKPGPGCKAQQEVFTRDYYKGDRSMRESGFDVTFRFGPYGGSTHHFAPVCLNSLLYKTEKDLEQIATTLGMAQDAQRWHDAAATLKEAIDQYLWDAKKGMYFDYRDDLQRRSDYQYASTFYPLWAGAASPDQARAVLANLSTFEKPGGIVMSPVQTGVQWDFPYGWAPVNLVAVEGLRRYGFNDDANRISHNFVTMIVQDFQHDHTIREKYNVVTRSTETKVQVGYQENMIGFGWTNGTFLTLLQDLPQNWQDRIARGDLQPIYPPEKGATGGK
jgi:alpha,alpha-trehalase